MVPEVGHWEGRAHDVSGPDAVPKHYSLNDAKPPDKIRILLADDHQILREGLASLLAEELDMEIVGEAGDGQEAIELARLARPDVILMDVTMPRLDGIQATRQITAEMPDVAVIGLSMHEEDEMAAEMRNAGAAAYLSKGGPSEALIAAIRGRSSASRRRDTSEP